MTYHSMKAGLLAVVAALLIGSPASSRPPEDDDLRKDVRALKEDLARLKRDVDIDRTDAADRARRLEAKLDGIALSLEKLAATATTPRTSMSVTPVRRGTGTIRLDNRMNVQARVTIDGLEYTLPPRSVRTLRNQPTGAFGYEVTADGFVGRASYRSSLANNETLTVTVY